MPTKPAIKTVEEKEIPSVVEFMEAQEKVEKFKAQYKAVFEEYGTLVEQRNALLETADKVVRSMKVSCGPFDLYQQIVVIDTVKLFEELGRAGFLEAGGTIASVPEYKIEPATFDASVARHLIPEEVAKEVQSIQPRYHVPKKLLP